MTQHHHDRPQDNPPLPRVRPLARFTLTALALASLASGCAVDAGSEQLGYTDGPLTATPPIEPDVRPLDFFGRWRGTATDLLEPPGPDGDTAPYRFPSGSSDITLELFQEFGDFGAISGRLVFGSAPAPEATDPLSSYPPGTRIEDYDPAPAALEGASYKLGFMPLNSEIAPEALNPDGSFNSGIDVSLAHADGILRMTYLTSDMYSDWCALQTPLPNLALGPYSFNCLGAKGVSRASDGKCYTYNDDETDAYPIGSFLPGEVPGQVIPDPAREVDCARAYQCMEQCSCTDPNFYIDQGFEEPPGATYCYSGGERLAFGELWLRQAGDRLLGVLTGAAGFENSRGARTTLGQIEFERLPEP